MPDGLRLSLCDRCMGAYRVDLVVPDALWAIAAHRHEEKLCGSCIMERLERHARRHDKYGYLIVQEGSIN